MLTRLPAAYRGRGMGGPARNVEFANVVKRLNAGRSQRDVSRLCGFSHTYAGDMEWGKVPSRDVVEQYADGLGLDTQDRAELMTAAGYYDGGAYYAECLRGLRAKHGDRKIRVELRDVPGKDTPKEAVDLIIRTLDEDMQQEINTPDKGEDAAGR
jgi:hypothetical protein